jgi:hypothetical protein
MFQMRLSSLLLAMKKTFTVLFILSSSAAKVLSTKSPNYDDDTHQNTCVSSDLSCWPTANAWNRLNATVNGKLVAVVPPAQHCYSGAYYDKQECQIYQDGFFKDTHRESYIGAMQNVNWETCGKQDSCLWSPIFPLLQYGSCEQGALPHYGLNSTSVQDIAAVIQFSQKYHIAFNIKNTGHDYFGRSTSPNSITVWTHPLQKIEFHESFQSCGEDQPYKAFTFGAGVNWFDAYRAAHEHNVTLVGGAQAGVGVAGGWLLGGGHSVLSPAFGLGVDHVLQFKLILANGEHVIANKCQHPDLFWALRGGGGGSLGIVTEATIRTHPHVNIQFLALDITTIVSGEQRKLLLEFARHSARWAEEGWGGYFYYYSTGIKLLYANPLLSAEEANASLKPFLDFIDYSPRIYIKETVITGTTSGFYNFFMEALYKNSELVGHGIRLSSRLIPSEHFATDETRELLVDTFLEGVNITKSLSSLRPSMILLTTSLRVRDEEGGTSVQPLLRQSVWHVVYIQVYNLGNIYR